MSTKTRKWEYDSNLDVPSARGGTTLRQVWTRPSADGRDTEFCLTFDLGRGENLPRTFDGHWTNETAFRKAFPNFRPGAKQGGSH